MAEPFYRTFFQGDYQRAYADVLRRRDAQQEAEFIARTLGMRSGERVLDTVCGHGRHAIALARMGYRVSGADLSEVEVERARAAASAAELDVRFVVSDMRELPFESEFDAAFNAFTSFGYFESAEEDLRALRAFRRALREGGRFFIDTINPLAVARGWQPRDWERTTEGVLVLRERSWDLLGGIHHETITLLEPGEAERMYDLTVRTYTPDALRRSLEMSGFRVTASYGGWDGAPLTLSTIRLMLVAESV